MKAIQIKKYDERYSAKFNLRNLLLLNQKLSTLAQLGKVNFHV